MYNKEIRFENKAEVCIRSIIIKKIQESITYKSQVLNIKIFMGVYLPE